MNKLGFTITELLVSIALISVVILLLLKVMLSLNSISNDKTYASSDEIKRAEIIKNIESDFLELNLTNVEIKEESDKTSVYFKYKDSTKKLVIYKEKLIYDNIEYKLKSINASYNLKPSYEYLSLDNNYYLINLNIEVLIDNKNTTINDDISLVYVNSM